MPAMKPSAGLPGVDGVLVVTSSPESSSKATTSVKVPPVSMPILMRRVGAVGPAVMAGVNRRWPRAALAHCANRRLVRGQPSPRPRRS